MSSMSDVDLDDSLLARKLRSHASASNIESDHDNFAGEEIRKPSKKEKNVAKKRCVKEKKKEKKKLEKIRNNKIGKEDFYTKHTEFRTWLSEEKKLKFEDLSLSKAKDQFKKFMKHWNNDKLPKRYYRGIDACWTEGSPATQSLWAQPPDTVTTTPGSVTEEQLDRKYGRKASSFGTFGKKTGRRALRSLQMELKIKASSPELPKKKCTEETPTATIKRHGRLRPVSIEQPPPPPLRLSSQLSTAQPSFPVMIAPVTLPSVTDSMAPLSYGSQACETAAADTLDHSPNNQQTRKRRSSGGLAEESNKLTKQDSYVEKIASVGQIMFNLGKENGTMPIPTHDNTGMSTENSQTELNKLSDTASPLLPPPPEFQENTNATLQNAGSKTRISRRRLVDASRKPQIVTSPALPPPPPPQVLEDTGALRTAGKKLRNSRNRLIDESTFPVAGPSPPLPPPPPVSQGEACNEAPLRENTTRNSRTKLKDCQSYPMSAASPQLPLPPPPPPQLSHVDACADVPLRENTTRKSRTKLKDCQSYPMSSASPQLPPPQLSHVDACVDVPLRENTTRKSRTKLKDCQSYPMSSASPQLPPPPPQLSHVDACADVPLRENTTRKSRTKLKDCQSYPMSSASPRLPPPPPQLSHVDACVDVPLREKKTRKSRTKLKDFSSYPMSSASPPLPPPPPALQEDHNAPILHVCVPIKQMTPVKQVKGMHECVHLTTKTTAI